MNTKALEKVIGIVRGYSDFPEIANGVANAATAELNALRENYKASQKLLAIREEQIGEFLENQKTLQATAIAAQRLLNAQAELALALEKLDGETERRTDGERVLKRA
jgi:hypothetical protein